MTSTLSSYVLNRQRNAPAPVRSRSRSSSSSSSRSTSNSRPSPRVDYYQWLKATNVKNKLGFEQDDGELLCTVCVMTGKIFKTKAHVLPHADKYTAPLDGWMTSTRLFGISAEDIAKDKVTGFNLVALHSDFADQMEPSRGKRQFSFFPTRETMIQLIIHQEKSLIKFEKSRASFLGYNSRDVLSDWPIELEGLPGVKVYEYEPLSFTDGIYNILVERWEEKGIKHETLHRITDRHTRPIRYSPPFPNLALPLSPFNVILYTWKILKCQQEEDMALGLTTPDLDVELYERIFVLGEYFLQLAEVDTPSGFRLLNRPTCLARDFTIPPRKTPFNKTHRFTLPSDVDATYTRSGKRYSSGSSVSASKSGGIGSAEAGPPEARKQTRSTRAQTSASRRQRMDDVEDPLSSLMPSSPPVPTSPVLSDSSEASSALEVEEELLTPETISILDSDEGVPSDDDEQKWIDYYMKGCPCDSLAQWSDEVSQRLQDTRQLIFQDAIPDGFITSAGLQRLRCSRKYEDVMIKLHEQLDDIEWRQERLANLLSPL